MQVIGIDVGRDAVKVFAGYHRKPVVFPSRIGEARELRVGDYGDYVLEYNGQKLFVGNMAKESISERDMTTISKIHEETKILFLTGIAAVAEQEYIFATICVPINQHCEDIKKNLTTLLEGEHDLKINGHEKKLKITVGVVGECIAAYWGLALDDHGQIKQDFVRKRIRGLDIGSVTVNGMTLEWINHKPRLFDKECFTLEYGIIALNNADSEIDQQYARKIKSDTAKKWLTYRPDEEIVFMTGGGSLRLKEHIQNMFTVSIVSESPVIDNAKGCYNMGLLKCQKAS